MTYISWRDRLTVPPNSSIGQQALVDPAFLSHHLDEFLEQISGVVRSGAGLRVKLHAHDLLVFVNVAFEAAIIQIDVRYRAADVLERRDIDREAMILAG